MVCTMLSGWDGVCNVEWVGCCLEVERVDGVCCSNEHRSTHIV